MSALVLLHHDQPMTTSLAIANGVQLTHEPVIKLIRKHVDRLAKFGEIGFEIRFNPQGKQTEFAWLNEPQATLLLTFMRNSDVVMDFKEALVRAFFDLRDRAKAAEFPHRSDPLNMNHRADIAVATERVFRSWLRAGRSAGLSLSGSLAMANRKAVEATGVDVLSEMGIDPEEQQRKEESTRSTSARSALSPSEAAVHRFLDEWVAGRLNIPCQCCLGADLYTCYLRWCRWVDMDGGCWPVSHSEFSAQLNSRSDMRIIHRGMMVSNGRAATVRCVRVHAKFNPPPTGIMQWTTDQVVGFKRAMEVAA